MYNKVECIVLTCDNCQEEYRNEHSGFSIFIDENSANDEADNDEWYLDEYHYCPKCHSINDEDELIIDTSRTQPAPTNTQEKGEDWVRVEDGEMPAIGHRVLMLTESGLMRIGYRYKDDWYAESGDSMIDLGYDITHYIELPTPPIK